LPLTRFLALVQSPQYGNNLMRADTNNINISFALLKDGGKEEKIEPVAIVNIRQLRLISSGIPECLLCYPFAWLNLSFLTAACKLLRDYLRSFSLHFLSFMIFSF